MPLKTTKIFIKLNEMSCFYFKIKTFTLSEQINVSFFNLLFLAQKILFSKQNYSIQYKKCLFTKVNIGSFFISISLCFPSFLISRAQISGYIVKTYSVTNERSTL